MEANAITLLRILLCFVTVVFFQTGNVFMQGGATALVALVLYLDALDGLVARKLKIASDFGALFDIAGDRVVEAVLWIYFASCGIFSIWIPMIIITRGFLTDNIRTVAYKNGQTPFGAKTMMKSAITKFLVASRFSRALYGVAKTFLFVYAGVLIFLKNALQRYGWQLPSHTIPVMADIAQVTAYLTLFMCIIRGIPVIWDGRAVLFEKMYPRDVSKPL